MKGVFDESGISDLGRLIYYISLPCLIFTNILTEVDTEKLGELWRLPFFAVLHITSGYIIGKILNGILRLKGLEAKATILCSMFGNVGALTIAVVDTLCKDEPLLSAIGPTCATEGVSFVAFYLITQNILMFTWGESILDLKGNDDDSDSESGSFSDDAERRTEKTPLHPKTVESYHHESHEEIDDDTNLNAISLSGSLQKLESHLALDTIPSRSVARKNSIDQQGTIHNIL